MTVINAEMSKSTFDLSIKGHANYAEHGKDIVCAGVSTLACTLLNALIDMQREGELNVFTYKSESGDVELHAEVESWYRHEFRHKIEIILLGLKMIAEEYPNYVKIEND